MGQVTQPTKGGKLVKISAPQGGNLVEISAQTGGKEVITDTRIEAGDLPPTIREVVARREVRLRVGLSMPEIEREVFQAYVETYGSKKEAAKALRIALRTFHAKAKRYGLQKARPVEPAADAAGAPFGTSKDMEVQNRHPADSSGAEENAKLAFPVARLPSK